MATIDISCDSGDCWANKNNQFGDGSAGYLWVIDDNLASNANVKTWIPFTIPLPRVQVQQAYLYLTPYANQSSNNYLYLACELAANPSAPTTGADLNGRTLTTYQTNLATGIWTLDSERSFQFDNPVQEVFNQSGWQVGNTLAVILYDNGTIGDTQYRMYSYEGDTSKRARLVINYDELPIIGGSFI